MAAFLNIIYEVISEIRLRQSVPNCLKNNPVTFHSDPIWNDGTFGFLKTGEQQEEQQDE